MNDYITGIVDLTVSQTITVSINEVISSNLYKSVCRIFNLPLTYNQGFEITVNTVRNTFAKFYTVRSFSIVANDNANRKLDFLYTTTGNAYIPINISKTGFIRYEKNISSLNVPNLTNLTLTDNLTIAGNTENYVLGSKIGGIWSFNYPTNTDGLMYTNHNRYVRLDIQVRLNVTVSTFQGLKIRIKRGNGTYVDNNIAILNTSNDTPETTTLMATYSSGLADPYVSSGFALELRNDSGATVTLPTQTLSIQIGLTYY
jgi:hypothetical protein